MTSEFRKIKPKTFRDQKNFIDSKIDSAHNIHTAGLQYKEYCT